MIKLSQLSEREIVEAVLRAANGCVLTAAVALGVSKCTLYSMVSRNNINLAEYRPTEIKEAPHSRWKPGKSTNGLAWYKQQRILEELEKTNYNRTQTARNLDISLSTIKAWVRHLKAQGFDIPDSGQL